MSAKQKRKFIFLTVNRVLFSVMLLTVLLFDVVPSLRASATDLTQGIESAGGVQQIDPARVIISGEQGMDSVLPGGKKITLRHGEYERYASTRKKETVGQMLFRLQPSMDAVELALVEVQEDGVLVTVTSDYVLHETVTEEVGCVTVFTPDYTLAKGEKVVTSPGVDGVREVVYETVYSDGRMVSRQAVEELSNTSVPEYAKIGTLVQTAEDGDTIRSVVRYEDGSGYLIMESGDSLHFTGTMNVKCTAYTTGYGGVGTRTYTGTTVRRGCAAVDKRVIPLGTTMFVTTESGSYTYGMAYAEDVGVRGEKVDLYMDSYQECKQFGIRKSIVYFLDGETK